MHISVSVFINDENGLHEDFDKWLEKLAPYTPADQYKLNRTGVEDNEDTHLKLQVMVDMALLPLQMANWILVHGSRYFIVN